MGLVTVFIRLFGSLFGIEEAVDELRTNFLGSFKIVEKIPIFKLIVIYLKKIIYLPTWNSYRASI